MDISKLRKSSLLFPALIVLIELILFIANFRPGAFLIGWDNVMPEFDLKTNLLRSVYSIWQEYRGLGLLDGMAHSANLMHTIYIGLLSLIAPEASLRFIYIHLTHLIGGLSFFFLLKKLTKNDKAAFFGSLFYLFNIGTVQMYFAPLEVFATHFAALPTIVLFAINALEKPKPKQLLLLFLASFLLSPQGFVPTVFIAFGIFFFFLLLSDFLKHHNIKKLILIGLVVFSANAFWAVPYLYSGINTGKYIENSRINEFSSEEIFFRNKSFGDLASVLTLKGFMIDTIELNPNTFHNDYFMAPWRNLVNNPIYNIVYLGFFATIIYGIYFALKKRHFEYLPFVLTAGVAFTFLANDTPIFSQINDLIRSAFPLIGEAFRFPFTKFITVFVFSLSALFTLGLSTFLNKFKEYEKYLILCVFVGLIAMIYPAFFGYFTSPFLKELLPQEYVNLFADMQRRDINQRLVLFPVQTFWNWQYRSWGQRGSGFSWYGIPQPIFERAFDPWSPYDEQFYNEISYAVNAQDQELFNNVLKKYDMNYILLDQYMLNTLSQKEINYESLKNFLQKDPLITIDKTYGKLILYKIKQDTGWVYDLNQKTTKTVFPNYAFEKEDSIYPLTDNYISGSDNPSVVNLFPSLYTEKLQENLEFNVENDKDKFVLRPKKNLDYNLSNYILRIPSLFETEFLVPVKVKFEKGQIVLTPSYPQIEINGNQLDINEDPIVLTPKSVTNPTEITFSDTKQSIKTNKEGLAYILNPSVNTIEIKNKNGAKELIYLDTANIHKKSFYASLPPGNIKDLSITFPKIAGAQSYTNIIEDRKFQIVDHSSPFANSYSSIKKDVGLTSVDLSSVDGSTELTFYLPDLYHQTSYILFAKSKYTSGLPMRFYVDNDVEKKAEVEAVFSKTLENTTVVIPKATNFFKGYGFHFIVKSVGKEKGESTISGIQIYPFPSRFLRALQIVDYNTYINPVNVNRKMSVSFTKLSPVLYETKETPGSILTLSQAYDKGWNAYEVKDTNFLSRNFPFIFGRKLSNHILVNNWANGWETNDNSQVVILYLPIYIQYFGYFITATSFLGLYIIYVKKRHLL